ncbi:hypothetical protein ISN45_Aa05g012610, partial [Arabidopsis thaliana x Arabidopsis arenosa]
KSELNLLAVFDDPLPIVNCAGDFVKRVESLSSMENNSAKLENGRTPHCWTFFSSKQSFSVRAGMLQGVEIALGFPEGSIPKPVYTCLIDY